MADSMSTPIEEQVNNAAAIKVYPNPAHQTISIEIPAVWQSQALKLSIYDELGRLVGYHPISNRLSRIDIGHFPKGMYQYVIHDSTSRFSSGTLVVR